MSVFPLASSTGITHVSEANFRKFEKAIVSVSECSRTLHLDYNYCSRIELEAHFRHYCSHGSVLKLASSTLYISSTLLTAIVPGSVFAMASSIGITRQVWNEMTSPLCFAIDSNVNDAGLLQSSCWTKYQSVNVFHEQFEFVLSNLFEVAEFLTLRAQTNFKRWAVLDVALA